MTTATEQPQEKRRRGRPPGVVSPGKLAALAEAPTTCAVCGCTMPARVRHRRGPGWMPVMTCSNPCAVTLQHRLGQHLHQQRSSGRKGKPVEVNGLVYRNAAALAHAAGISPDTLRARIRSGRSLDRLTAPARAHSRKAQAPASG